MICSALVAIIIALTIAGCGGGGGGNSSITTTTTNTNTTTDSCSFGDNKWVNIYFDKYSLIASISQDSSGGLTGTVYEDGFENSITGIVTASTYSLDFTFNDKDNSGKSFMVNLSGTAVDSGGVCVSASGH